MCKVGESITFSGLTVIGALATVVVATFGFYQGLGPALAIGIAVALPGQPHPPPRPSGRARSRRVLAPRPHRGPACRGRLGPHRRPGGGKAGRSPWSIGLVIFGGLALSMLAYSPNGFNDQPPPATSDSGRGQALLAADFPSVETNPTAVLFRLPVPVWDEPAVLADAQTGLVGTGQFSAVTGALDPDGVVHHPVGPGRGPCRPGLAGAGVRPARSTHRPASPCRPQAYRAYQASAQFISADGRTIQFDTGLVAGGPDSTAAAVGHARRAGRR